jgi:hypothetical protein
LQKQQSKSEGWNWQMVKYVRGFSKIISAGWIPAAWQIPTLVI